MTSVDQAWELWYQDTFDRETPRQVEKAGRGLTAGLKELWFYHLKEINPENNQAGFSRYNLWLTQEQKSILIRGDIKGLAQLRQWIFGNHGESGRTTIKNQGAAVLEKIASVHCRLVLAGETSEQIIELVTSCESQAEFEERLSGIAPQRGETGPV